MLEGGLGGEGIGTGFRLVLKKTPLLPSSNYVQCICYLSVSVYFSHHATLLADELYCEGPQAMKTGLLLPHLLSVKVCGHHSIHPWSAKRQSAPVFVWAVPWCRWSLRRRPDSLASGCAGSNACEILRVCVCESSLCLKALLWERCLEAELRHTYTTHTNSNRDVPGYPERSNERTNVCLSD